MLCFGGEEGGGEEELNDIMSVQSRSYICHFRIGKEFNFFLCVHDVTMILESLHCFRMFV